MSAATCGCMPLELGANRLCWLLQVAVMRRELRDPQTVLAGFVPSIEGVGGSDASKRSSLCVACCARARRVMSDNRAASCVSQPGSTALFVKNFLTCHRRCHSTLPLLLPPLQCLGGACGCCPSTTSYPPTMRPCCSGRWPSCEACATCLVGVAGCAFCVGGQALPAAPAAAGLGGCRQRLRPAGALSACVCLCSRASMDTSCYVWHAALPSAQTRSEPLCLVCWCAGDQTMFCRACDFRAVGGFDAKWVRSIAA